MRQSMVKFVESYGRRVDHYYGTLAVACIIINQALKELKIAETRLLSAKRAHNKVAGYMSRFIDGVALQGRSVIRNRTKKAHV